MEFDVLLGAGGSFFWSSFWPRAYTDHVLVEPVVRRIPVVLSCLVGVVGDVAILLKVRWGPLALASLDHAAISTGCLDAAWHVWIPCARGARPIDVQCGHLIESRHVRHPNIRAADIEGLPRHLLPDFNNPLGET